MRTSLYDPQDFPPELTLHVLGNKDSFSGQAAGLLQAHAPGVKIEYVKKMKQIRDAIERGGYGLLPTINYSSSQVDENIDALTFMPNARVVGNIMREVQMASIGTLDCDPSEVVRAQSHRQGIRQSSNYLSSLRTLEDEREMASTVAAVHDLAEHPDPRAIALASAASIQPGMDLRVVEQGVSNAERNGEQNATDFAVVHANGESPRILEGRQRHLLISTPVNQPGVLKTLAGIISDHGGDLYMLLSRPIGVEKYSFVVGFDHSGDERELAQIYAQLKGLSPLNDRFPVLQPLGSWNTKIWDPNLRGSETPRAIQPLAA